jgi:peptide/nickel transport system permease protein
MAISPATSPVTERLPARIPRRFPLRHVLWLRRIGELAVVMIGVTFLTFCMLNLLPGTAAERILGGDATKASIAELEQRIGSDKPFLEQYLVWLGHAVTGNFGASLASDQPVSSIIAQRLPVTAELIAASFILSLVPAVIVAVLAARWPRGLIDRLSMLISMAGLSIPPFVLGLILILIIAVRLRWLPSTGYVGLSAGVGPNLKTMILPAATIALPLFCSYTRVLRSDLVDQMISSDYVTLAEAKGVGPMRILIRHALRNSATGMLTLVGLSLGTMIGGTVVVEEIFGLPGLGQELILSITDKDVVVVEAIVLLLAVSVVVVNLLTDFVTMMLDPRLRDRVSDV